jgi:RNA polymerase sigma-70 factor (ECF subfamily)
MTSGPDSTLHDDALLLFQIKQNSKSAFDQLFEKYWESAYSSAYRRLKDADQAKDIIQDIFAHIWLHRATDQIQNFPAYLNTAIRNKVIKITSKQKTTHPFFNLLENISENAGNADHSLLWKEFYVAYETWLNSLPPQRQAIFRLRFHDDLPTKAIAARLGLSRKTVQNQLGMAVEKLRVSLISQWGILLIYLFLKIVGHR